MADFLDKLSRAIDLNAGDLRRGLDPAVAPAQLDLQSFVRDHWLDLPPLLGEPQRPAYAIDGSLGQVDLDNGSTLLVTQALCIGPGAFEEKEVDVQVLPPATPRPAAARFADLVQRLRELSLAVEVVSHHLPEESVLYLDGALYGLLPQLFPSPEDQVHLRDYPEQVLERYLRLLERARERRIDILAIAKSSREATQAKIWLAALPDHEGREIPPDLSDSGMLQRWTDGRPGLSAPVLLGKWSFTGGSVRLLDRQDVARSPAIASFFVRLAPWEEVLRVDLPAWQAGSDKHLEDLTGEMLPGDAGAVYPAVDLLRQDYGGPEVYNALLYGVDREVRMGRRMVSEVYLPLIARELGLPLRPDRSSRRFL